LSECAASALPVRSYTEALDLADKDINDNLELYKETFLRGVYP